jgi:hypothetical protein
MHECALCRGYWRDECVIEDPNMTNSSENSWQCWDWRQGALAHRNLRATRCCIKSTGKGKFVPVLFLTEHYTMKAHCGSGGIAPRIPDLGTRWRRAVTFTPRPLYPQGKIPLYSMDRRLGGPQNRSGRGGEEKNSHPLRGLEPTYHPARSPPPYRWATPAPLC